MTIVLNDNKNNDINKNSDDHKIIIKTMQI